MTATAALVLIGDELLSGRTQDTNGHFLGRRLDALGYRVRHVAVVPDEDAAIKAAVTDAAARAPLVFVTGGLGPTHDDRTTMALAGLLGVGLVPHEAQWEALLPRYEKRFGSVADAPPDLVASARRMIMVPDGATPLLNPKGAASAYAFDLAGSRVIVMPGVPREVESVFESSVVGVLVEPRDADTVEELDIGLPEAAFATRLTAFAAAHPDVTIGSYPFHDRPALRLRFRGAKDVVHAALAAAKQTFADDLLT